MLSAKEVAALLGLSSRKVYAMASSGQLPSYRFGDAVRFDPVDVEAFKASCRVVVRPVASPRLSSSPVKLTLRNADDELREYFRRSALQRKAKRKTKP